VQIWHVHGGCEGDRRRNVAKVAYIAKNAIAKPILSVKLRENSANNSQFSSQGTLRSQILHFHKCIFRANDAVDVVVAVVTNGLSENDDGMNAIDS